MNLAERVAAARGCAVADAPAICMYLRSAVCARAAGARLNARSVRFAQNYEERKQETVNRRSAWEPHSRHLRP